ncbi:MAG: hypothetical protein R3E32_14000 [Chitinophagales bacterium]
MKIVYSTQYQISNYNTVSNCLNYLIFVAYNNTGQNLHERNRHIICFDLVESKDKWSFPITDFIPSNYGGIVEIFPFNFECFCFTADGVSYFTNYENGKVLRKTHHYPMYCSEDIFLTIRLKEDKQEFIRLQLESDTKLEFELWSTEYEGRGNIICVTKDKFIFQDWDRRIANAHSLLTGEKEWTFDFGSLGTDYWGERLQITGEVSAVEDKIVLPLSDRLVVIEESRGEVVWDTSSKGIGLGGKNTVVVGNVIYAFNLEFIYQFDVYTGEVLEKVSYAEELKKYKVPRGERLFLVSDKYIIMAVRLEGWILFFDKSTYKVVDKLSANDFYGDKYESIIIADMQLIKDKLLVRDGGLKLHIISLEDESVSI